MMTSNFKIADFDIKVEYLELCKKIFQIKFSVNNNYVQYKKSELGLLLKIWYKVFFDIMDFIKSNEVNGMIFVIIEKPNKYQKKQILENLFQHTARQVFFPKLKMIELTNNRKFIFYEE